MEVEDNNSRFGTAQNLTPGFGYGGTISSQTDEDWFTFSMEAGEKVGLLLDGFTSDVSIEAFSGSDGSPFSSFSGDGFSEELYISNNRVTVITIYIRVMPTTVQNYRLLLEGGL